MQLRFGSAMSFDNRLIEARCIGGAWSLGEAHSQNERLWNGCWRAKWTIVVWDQRPAVVVHRHSLHVRHRFGAADPGPVIRRALLEIWAVKSSILERSSLRIGEVFALL